MNYIELSLGLLIAINLRIRDNNIMCSLSSELVCMNGQSLQLSDALYIAYTGQTRLVVFRQRMVSGRTGQAGLAAR